MNNQMLAAALIEKNIDDIRDECEKILTMLFDLQEYFDGDPDAQTLKQIEFDYQSIAVKIRIASDIAEQLPEQLHKWLSVSFKMLQDSEKD